MDFVLGVKELESQSQVYCNSWSRKSFTNICIVPRAVCHEVSYFVDYDESAQSQQVFPIRHVCFRHCHKELNLRWAHNQTGQGPWRGSVLLQSTAAFLPGARSLHTQIPTLLELAQITTWVRKCCSTSRSQGCRTPGTLTDRWDAENFLTSSGCSHFLRLNEIIRSQYLQRAVQVTLQVLP